MTIEIENWNWKLKLKIEIENWNSECEWKIEIKNQNSKLIPSLKISCAARVKEIGPNI